jgi:hypothetical protein
MPHGNDTEGASSHEAGVFALSGLQAVITVIRTLAWYVAPRPVSPVGKPLARVATVCLCEI